MENDIRQQIAEKEKEYLEFQEQFDEFREES